jgi:hypothetical protein
MEALIMLPTPDHHPDPRGILLWLWAAAQLASFARVAGCPQYAVYVPPGWRLVPNAVHGVVLTNDWGRHMTAAEVLQAVRDGQPGWRFAEEPDDG